MRKLFVLLLIMLMALSTAPALAVRVKGYRRKDGVYVRPHTRKKPRRRRHAALPVELEARALAAIRAEYR